MSSSASLEFPYPPLRPWPEFPLKVRQRKLWVFGYGSLMWNPGFPFCESQTGRLYGYHRDLCVRSLHYRGNARHPGLVLGLDKGGSCNGVCYRIAGADRAAVLAYLQQRELFINIYHAVFKRVVLNSGLKISALCFIVDRTQAQYTGSLSVEQVTRIVAKARGRRGDNKEYVINTLLHLQELGFPCRRLQQVVDGLSARSLVS